MGRPVALSDAARAYVEGRLHRQEIRPTSARSFAATLGSLGRYLGPKRPVSTIERADVEGWLAQLGQTLARRTVATYLTVARGFFADAVERGLTRRNPCASVRGPRSTRSVPRGVTEAELRAIFARCKDEREELIVRLMLEAGLRAKEVAGLELADVDTLGETLYVRNGKGGSQRMVPLAPSVTKALAAYLTFRGRRAGALIQPKVKSQWNPDDGITPRTVTVIASRVMHAAGSSETGHALRHQFAHDMVDAGAPLDVVQVALGHKNIGTTLIYTNRRTVGEMRAFVGRKNRSA